mgnify:CR=1 FL=1
MTPNERQFNLTIHFHKYLNEDRLCTITPLKVTAEVELLRSMKSGQETYDCDSDTNHERISSKVREIISSLINPPEIVDKVEVVSVWTGSLITTQSFHH